LDEKHEEERDGEDKPHSRIGNTLLLHIVREGEIVKPYGNSETSGYRHQCPEVPLLYLHILKFYSL